MAQKFRWHTKRIKGFMQPRRFISINKKHYQLVGDETFMSRKMAKSFAKSQDKYIRWGAPNAKVRIIPVGDKFAVYYTANRPQKIPVSRTQFMKDWPKKKAPVIRD